MKSVATGQAGPLKAMLAASIALALYAVPVQAQTAATPARLQPRDRSGTGDDRRRHCRRAATRRPRPRRARRRRSRRSTAVGFRASLEKALEIKRANVGVVDAIVAEDIANFPDLNLAESLQRIPGVSIARDAGEGRNISVRGLDSQFTRVRINGMEALTTTGGTDSSGGANRGRGFDFNVFASELFNSLTVRKTASADIEEGSLGATVDLQTRAALRLRRLHLRRRRRSWATTTCPEDYDPRAAMLISNTWADGTFGALLSVAYTDRNLIEEGHSTVRWDNGTSSGGFARASPFARRAPGHHLPSAHPALRRARARAGAPGHHRLAAVRSPATGTDVRPGRDVRRLRRHPHRELPRGDFLQPHRRAASRRPSCATASIDADGNLVYGLFDNVDVRSEVALRRAATPSSPSSACTATHALHRRLPHARRWSATPSPSSTTRSRPRSPSTGSTPTATPGTTATTTACR